jgi:hypothetical protein
VQPEPLVRAKLDRDELRYTWTDADGNVRASDDGGLRPPKDWWTANSTTIDRGRREVWGNAVVVPTFLTMFFVNVYPVTPADKSAPQKRHAPKSESAIAVLKDIYPPDGCPSRQAVPDSELERAYHKECDRRDIHKNDRVKHTQLLRWPQEVIVLPDRAFC